MIPAPLSRMCWSMRCPSLETNHFSVSQIWYWPSAMSAPCSPIVVVARTSRSPLSASETVNGSIAQSLAHDAGDGLARHQRRLVATRRARSPRRSRRPGCRRRGRHRTRGRVRRRTPTPTRPVRVRRDRSWRPATGTRPRRCARTSTRVRRCITRASAYLAPASSAAWTAASAASNSLMPSTLERLEIFSAHGTHRSDRLGRTFRRRHRGRLDRRPISRARAVLSSPATSVRSSSAATWW